MRTKKEIDFLVILVSLFIITGVTTPDVHTTYFAVAFIFFVPLIYNRKEKFTKYFWITLLTYLFFNIVFNALDLAGKGVGNTLRF